MLFGDVPVIVKFDLKLGLDDILPLVGPLLFIEELGMNRHATLDNQRQMKVYQMCIVLYYKEA